MENIISTDVVDELKDSYLTYSMSVITARAIPSIEDGFKPGARRLLWSMLEDGILSDKKVKKCSIPVSSTMGKYHPHGDSSIYETLVNLSQPWSMRYPIIDFSGNNGSRDGDGAAAFRYTECRLAKTAEFTMEGIKKNAVDFIPNYTGELKEPKFLPGFFPHLLCNGTLGIAVGYACNWIPHNLNNVADSIIAFVDNPDISTKELVDIIKGPDFPTGGIIVNGSNLYNCYESGKGKVIVRGEYYVDGNKIIFTSIPYGVSKSNLAIQINDACEAGKINNVKEIRDESGRKNVRFVIELTKSIEAEKTLKELFAHSALQNSYNFNQVAIVEGKPRVLSLKDTIYYYVKHQKECLVRIYDFDINKLSKRNHILEGFLIALEDIDNVINVIKNSESSDDAKIALCNTWNLTEEQAKAVLDIKLSRLTKMDKIKVNKELKENKEKIQFLNNKKEHLDESLIEIVKDMKKKFGDERLTNILDVEYDFSKEDTDIANEDVIVTLAENGYIKRTLKNSYKPQSRNGKGIKNGGLVISNTISTNTKNSLLCFTNLGNMYRIAVNNIVEGTNADKGINITDLISLKENEKILTLANYENNNKYEYILFITENGKVKKTKFEEYSSSRKTTGLIAIKLKDDDKLIAAIPINNEQFVIGTKEGKCVLLNSAEVKTQSRATMGAKGITLKDSDKVVAAALVESTDDYIVTINNKGLGKKNKLEELTNYSLGSKGISILPKDEELKFLLVVNDNDVILLSGSKHSITLEVTEISDKSRIGVGVMLLKDEDIVCASKI